MSIFTGVLYFILWLGLVTIFVVYVTCSNAVFMFWFALWWIIKLYSIKEQRNVGYSLLFRLVTFSLTIKLSIATFKNPLCIYFHYQCAILLLIVLIQMIVLLCLHQVGHRGDRPGVCSAAGMRQTHNDLLSVGYETGLNFRVTLICCVSIVIVV